MVGTRLCEIDESSSSSPSPSLKAEVDITTQEDVSPLINAPRTYIRWTTEETGTVFHYFENYLKGETEKKLPGEIPNMKIIPNERASNCHFRNCSFLVLEVL